MKETIHTKNSFKSANIECLKKSVTEKVSKIVDRQIKKTG